jgi:1-aminocyclopropane-1-carboxylate deaminase
MKALQIPLQELLDETIESSGIRLYMLRLDQLHPVTGGNKLFKLKYYLQEAIEKGKKTLLTFGGAFSNHIAATALKANENGFLSIGIIRGEEVENPLLKLAKENGMQLHFVSRELYRDKNKLLAFANEKFGDDPYIIPEGGAGEQGIKGCTEILDSISIPFDTICCACGTGTTLTGIAMSLKDEEKALGFQVLKGENYLKMQIADHYKSMQITDQYRSYRFTDNLQMGNWDVNEDFHFGGYAKATKELMDFIEAFRIKHNILLDHVYNGKMMFGIYEMLRRGEFKKGETIIALNTGGLPLHHGDTKDTEDHRESSI